VEPETTIERLHMPFVLFCLIECELGVRLPQLLLLHFRSVLQSSGAATSTHNLPLMWLTRFYRKSLNRTDRFLSDPAIDTAKVSHTFEKNHNGDFVFQPKYLTKTLVHRSLIPKNARAMLDNLGAGRPLTAAERQHSSLCTKLAAQLLGISNRSC
jgi:hypothetical protein